MNSLVGGKTESAPRMRRLIQPEPSAAPRRVAAGLCVISLTVWWALVTGLVETALMFAMLAGTNAAAMGNLQMNRHALWMITASDLAIFASVGAPLALVAFLTRRVWTLRLSQWVLATLGFFAWVQMIKGLTLTSGILLAAGLGAFVARRLDPQGLRFSKVRRLTLPLLALAAIGLVGVQYGGDALAEQNRLAALVAAPKDAPNVVLVVLDTVRADALSCYGYSRPTTPNLDRLAARGYRFEKARAPGAWTLPSHASMFTSRWPHELSARIDAPLDETYPTIAEHLSNHGYATAGFIANTFFCNAWFGLGRGFSHYNDMALTPRTVVRTSHLGRRILRSVGTERHERPASHFSRKDAATINREFLGWVDKQRDQKRPFFVFLNYFDAHDPYLMPRPEGKPFGRVAQTTKEVDMLRNWNLLDGKKLSAEQLALARDCYDDCLAQLDREVGRLMDQLASRGVLENTWLIFTSDHGEQFGEHGFIGHGNSVHRQTVHVPLLIVPPSAQAKSSAGGVIPQDVSTRDIPQTIVDLCGLPQPQTAFQGRSLARFWKQPSAEDLADSFVYSEIIDHDGPTPPNWQMPRSLVSGGFVYIVQCDGREDLYDATNDPDETQNLAALPEHAARLDEFRSLMKSLQPQGKAH